MPKESQCAHKPLSKLENTLPQEVKIGVKIGVNFKGAPKVDFHFPGAKFLLFLPSSWRKRDLLLDFTSDPAKTCKFYSFARAPKNQENLLLSEMVHEQFTLFFSLRGQSAWLGLRVSLGPRTSD